MLELSLENWVLDIMCEGGLLRVFGVYVPGPGDMSLYRVREFLRSLANEGLLGSCGVGEAFEKIEKFSMSFFMPTKDIRLRVGGLDGSCLETRWEMRDFTSDLEYPSLVAADMNECSEVSKGANESSSSRRDSARCIWLSVIFELYRYMR